jgi:hypothetical protein
MKEKNKIGFSKVKAKKLSTKKNGHGVLQRLAT